MVHIHEFNKYKRKRTYRNTIKNAASFVVIGSLAVYSMLRLVFPDRQEELKGFEQFQREGYTALEQFGFNPDTNGDVIYIELKEINDIPYKDNDRVVIDGKFFYKIYPNESDKDSATRSGIVTLGREGSLEQKLRRLF